MDSLCEPSLYCSLYYIPSHKPFIILCITSLYTNHQHKLNNHTNHLSFSVLHPFTQTIPSHKPIINTQTIYHSVYDIPSHKPSNIPCMSSLHTDHLFKQTIISHKPFIILCITYYLVFLIIWYVWTIPVLFAVLHPFTQTIPSDKPFIISLNTNQEICNTENAKWFVWRLVCVKGWFMWRMEWFVWKDVIQRMINGSCNYVTQTITSHKPSPHTNHLAFSV